MTLVQSKSGTVSDVTATGSLTVTLTGSTVAGNALVLGIVVAGATTNSSVASVTLGGSATGWSSAQTGGASNNGGIASFWVNPNVAGGQTSIVITVSGGSGNQTIFCWADERDDIASVSPFDKGVGAVSSSGTSWSSGATATTTQAAEVWYGLAYGINAPTGVTITPPGSPWSNHTQINAGLSSESFNGVMTTGWQTVAATGACTYNGTFSASEQWVAVAATFKAKAAGGVSILPQQAKKRMPAYFTRINTPSRNGGVYAR